MSKKKPKKPASAIVNRRASYDYALGQKFSAGIALSGTETKSIRLGRAHLRGAYIQVMNNELYLMNATITPFQGGTVTSSMEPTRARKLLVKKRELETLKAAKQQGMSLVPTAFTTRTRFIKVEFALGKGKRTYDKRQVIKQRDTERDTRRHGI